MATTAQRKSTQTIRFDAALQTIDKSVVVRLPKEASAKLPSRGQVATRGTINGHEFTAVVEPDGSFGHWLKVDAAIRRIAGARAGDTATFEIEAIKDWPEPKVPSDLEAALSAAPQKIKAVWNDITPMARWEWVRWVNSTRNMETRKRRVEVSISKMTNGKRRPCCFDLSSCTDPELSLSGRLREPE